MELQLAAQTQNWSGVIFAPCEAEGCACNCGSPSQERRACCVVSFVARHGGNRLPATTKTWQHLLHHNLQRGGIVQLLKPAPGHEHHITKRLSDTPPPDPRDQVQRNEPNEWDKVCRCWITDSDNQP